MNTSTIISLIKKMSYCCFSSRPGYPKVLYKLTCLWAIIPKSGGESHKCAHGNFGPVSQERLGPAFSVYRPEQPGHAGCYFIMITITFMANILHDKDCDPPYALQRGLAEVSFFFF